MKGYDAIARSLLDQGVDTLFGLLGDANMDHIARYVEDGRGRYVPAVDERGATCMADGYFRVSGRVGVASVTHGPGAANTVNPLIEAVRAHSKVLILTGDTPSSFVGHAQAVDLAALFSATGASFRTVTSVDELVDDVGAAIAEVDASNHPMVLNIPTDVQNSDVRCVRPSPHASVATPTVPVDPDTLSEALNALASAERPLILAGRGAVLAEAREQLIELADLLQAPLATTASGKDLFRGHPYNLGIMGGISFPWAMDVVAKADCVVAFGASLNVYTTQHGSLLEGKRLIHCDVAPERIGIWTSVDIAVPGDAAKVAAALVRRLRETEFMSPSSFRQTALGDGVADRRPTDDFEDASGTSTLDMRTAAVALEELLPTDKVVVTDTGRFIGPVWSYLHVAEARKFAHSLSWSSTGFGIATAIGAAMGCPGTLPVAIVGDGGGMMGMIELITAARENLPLVVVVMNDGAYGAEYGKLLQHGLDPRHALLRWPDFAAVATSLGATGVTVRSLTDLEMAVSLIDQVSGPLLIDVRADPAL